MVMSESWSLDPSPSIKFAMLLLAASNRLGETSVACILADACKMIIVLPPISEQKAIATFLNSETAKIDALISKIREGIEKLKEYNTALISAAVTGKIDLREAIALQNYENQ